MEGADEVVVHLPFFIVDEHPFLIRLLYGFVVDHGPAPVLLDRKGIAYLEEVEGLPRVPCDQGRDLLQGRCPQDGGYGPQLLILFERPLRIETTSSSVRGERVRTFILERRGATISKEGFSVVAPMRMTSPFST